MYTSIKYKCPYLVFGYVNNTKGPCLYNMYYVYKLQNLNLHSSRVRLWDKKSKAESIFYKIASI